MKILLLADEPDKMLWDHLEPKRLEEIELIISCGDLPRAYLEFLTCFTNAPIVYIPGNHDEGYVTSPPEGCICCDGRIVDVKGFRILGLGGSMRYKPGPYTYTEKMMAKRVKQLRSWLHLYRGFDLLVTHAPLRGHRDMDDLAHRGFECFRPLLHKYRPMAYLYAHVHGNYQGAHFQRFDEYQGIQTINAWCSCVIDLEPPVRPKYSLPRKLLIQLKSRDKDD